MGSSWGIRSQGARLSRTHFSTHYVTCQRRAGAKSRADRCWRHDAISSLRYGPFCHMSWRHLISKYGERCWTHLLECSAKNDLCGRATTLYKFALHFVLQVFVSSQLFTHGIAFKVIHCTDSAFKSPRVDHYCKTFTLSFYANKRAIKRFTSVTEMSVRSPTATATNPDLNINDLCPRTHTPVARRCWWCHMRFAQQQVC